MIQQVRMAVDQETADIIEEVVDRLTEAIQEATGGSEQPEWAKRATQDLAAIQKNQDKLRRSIEASASRNAISELEASIRSQASKLDQLDGVATSAEVSALAGSLNQTLEPAIGSLQQAIPRAIGPIEEKIVELQVAAHSQWKTLEDLRTSGQSQETKLASLDGLATAKQLERLKASVEPIQALEASIGSMQRAVPSALDALTIKQQGLRDSLDAQQSALEQLGNQLDEVLRLVQQQQKHLDAQQNALTTLSKPWYKRLFGG